MKKTVAALAAFLFPGLAFASFHAAPMPSWFSAIPSSWSALWYEVSHFMLHLWYTADGILQTLFISPQVGWLMIDGQMGCATLSPLVAFMFGSGISALITFFATMATLGIAACFIVAYLIRRFGRRRMLSVA